MRSWYRSRKPLVRNAISLCPFAGICRHRRHLPQRRHEKRRVSSLRGVSVRSDMRSMEFVESAFGGADAQGEGAEHRMQLAVHGPSQ
uniref:Uncharacterized protein n=1 Tax=Mycena chlorophos TaxID=658473 RepID=A0ABQ0L7A9_MYCCL|nr:predicted protein [Mycena chlorophos]